MTISLTAFTICGSLIKAYKDTKLQERKQNRENLRNTQGRWELCFEKNSVWKVWSEKNMIEIRKSIEKKKKK